MIAITEDVLSTHAGVEAGFYRPPQTGESTPCFAIADPWAWRLKRGLDLFLVLALALPVGFLTLLLCLLVMGDGGKPVYRHRRLGRGGRMFNCYKIRSMVLDADSRLQALLDSDHLVREEWSERFKLKCDPRVTKVGQLLRRTSLDELPQLWNVLRGDMSFVGPRPIIAAELEQYGDSAAAYLACVPGISGLWQVSGRSDTTYEERVRLDTHYARNWSLGLDLRILARTVPAMLARRGVY